MIDLKSEREVELLRAAGRVVNEIHRVIHQFLRPGISSKEIERKAVAEIEKRGAISAFLGYRGYPANICVSINEEVVHGIPSRRKLASGDIVSIDIGVKYNGYYGDCAWTYGVGKIKESAARLLAVAEASLYQGVEQARAGRRISDISHAVQSYVEANHFSVVRDFVGHGIGARMHEEPQIPNFGKPNRGPRLREGMVLAIEPMVNEGSWEVDIQEDGWTVVTRDGKLAAHFEHMAAVRENEAEILTRLPG